jgi:hypothetical protein
MTTPEAPEAPSPSPADPAAPAGPPEGDKGFPEGTPLAEMNDAQKPPTGSTTHVSTRTPSRRSKGLTPQQVSDLQAKVERTFRSRKASRLTRSCSKQPATKQPSKPGASRGRVSATDTRRQSAVHRFADR